MAKRGSIRRIKANRHYTYRDAADLLGFKPQTIRAWRKVGLQVMTDKRPHLILGANLIAFQMARHKPSAKMAPDQLKCFKCGPTRALDRIVFYTPYTPHRGQLEAICEVCGEACFRFEGAKKLSEKSRFFEIVRNNPSQG